MLTKSRIITGNLDVLTKVQKLSYIPLLCSFLQFVWADWKGQENLGVATFVQKLVWILIWLYRFENLIPTKGPPLTLTGSKIIL